MPVGLKWTAVALATFVIVCWLMVPLERTCTDDKGCAIFGYAAILGLVASLPIWLLAVIATMIWTAMAGRSKTRTARQRLVMLLGEALAVVIHPLPWVWLLNKW